MSDSAAAGEPAGVQGQPAAAPASSSASVSYKRKRSSKACFVCRQKKVRCSGTEPCRHCIEFGENVGYTSGSNPNPQTLKPCSPPQCTFEEASVQPTKSLSELQLRIIRLETYIVHFTGEELQPLANFRGLDSEDGSNGNGSSIWNTITASRKRQRQDEVSEPEMNEASFAAVSGSKAPCEPSQVESQQSAASLSGSQAQTTAHEQSASQNPERAESTTTHAYLDEARYLQDMTSNHDTSLPRDHGAKQRTLYHPFTSRIRATARDIPPEEMFSTDDDDAAAQGDQQARREVSMGYDGPDLPSDNRGLDDNAPRSPPLSSQRGFAPESSHTFTPSASISGTLPSSSIMKRTGSASSAPAALGPTTAKISSSNVSDFRIDKKGNLRYLGSASTSAVVAELADRQRWDVESPAIILNAQDAAAAARRKSGTRPVGNNYNNNNNGANGYGNIASSSSSTTSLAPVEELDDTSTENAPDMTSNRGFARPPMRPKPWEIFSNLGLTVAGALPPVEEIALPPEDLAKSLIDGFFEHIHPLFPVLHRMALVRDMNTVYALRAKGEMRKADPPFLTLLFAVFACGALVSDDPRVYEEGGYSDDAKTYPVEQGPLDPFAQWQNDLLGARSDTASQGQARTSTYNFGRSDAARRQGVRRAGHRYYAQVNILILHSLFQPSVDQAVLYGLMSYYHVSSNAAARAWLLSGQALRLAIELGLHRSSANFKPYVRERRRRVFWALFSLESLLANNLGRPSSIPLYEIDQEKPENICLDDLLPTVNTYGPPRKGEIAGFLHLVKLHWILAETLRTISRHQRHTRPISAAELQKRLLKYEMDVKDWFCSFPPEYTFKRGTASYGGLSKDCLTQNYIMHLSFHCALLLLFMPFMPRKGEDATEFQTYALARCVYACKDHIDFTARYQYPIPPSHYLFNITQHLLVAGALLLLICHRGLQDPKLLDRTIKDVDSCIEVLKVIGQRFVGGTIGAEMVQNMKDNMKHSETWKTRQKKIEEAEAAKTAGTIPNQGPLFPPMPLPGPRRIPGILQPSNGNDVASTSSTALRAAGSQAISGDQIGHAAFIPGSVFLGDTASVVSHPAGFTSQHTGNTMLSRYSAHEPGYLYPVQPPTVSYPVSEWQTTTLVGQGISPPNHGPSFLDDYLQMSGSSYNGSMSYMHPSTMQTYNTPESQPLWPSDNLNFDIKGLEEITARSYDSSFMNISMNNANHGNGHIGNNSNYPFF